MRDVIRFIFSDPPEIHGRQPGDPVDKREPFRKAALFSVLGLLGSLIAWLLA
jgi:hypothetical protein